MDRFAEITRKTQEVLARAEKLYGVKINPSIAFNLRGRVAGWAGCRFCRVTRQATQFTLRFNQDLINGKHFEDMRDETVPHEVAHLVCYARPDLGRKHDAGWRRVCIALGGNGNTRHDYDVVPVGGGFTYRATCGREITVSALIHRKIQAGQTRILKRSKGRINRDCAWAPHGQPLPHKPSLAPVVLDRVVSVVRTAPPAPVARPVAAVQAPVGGGSWADRVRAVIRRARAEGRGPDWVVQHAINDMGMKPTSARNCVKANWDRA